MNTAIELTQKDIENLTDDELIQLADDMNKLNRLERALIARRITQSIEYLTGCTITTDTTTGTPVLKLAQDIEKIVTGVKPFKSLSTVKNRISAINVYLQWSYNVGLQAIDFNSDTLTNFAGDLLTGRNVGTQYSVASVNNRLSVMRLVLRHASKDVTLTRVRSALNDWSNVPNVEPIKRAEHDKTNQDTGTRYDRDQLITIIESIPDDNIKGLRDRAIIALMAFFGLRVSEVTRITYRDLYHTFDDDTGNRVLGVINSKHGKTRFVPIDVQSWQYKVIDRYIVAIEQMTGTAHGVDLKYKPFVSFYRGLHVVRDTMTTRAVIKVCEALDLQAHDLRRSYAKMCVNSGIGMRELQKNLGHSSITTTEKYIGSDSHWHERVLR